jgi:hypothetical protein
MPSITDRPKSWNDDVRWLLSRILGIVSGSSTAPVGIPTSPVLERVRGSVSGQGAASETAITLPEYARRWFVVAVRFYPTAGSAATTSFTMGEAAGYATDSIDERISINTRATSIPIDEVLIASPGLGVPLETDGSNQLYFRAGWDAGADNDAEYDFWFVQAIEAQ